MRKFNITVNGNAYEVEVEEIDGGKSTNVAAPKVEVPKSAARPAAKPAPKKSAPVASGQEVISAPMPGSVWKVEVSEGQEVAAGDVLLILEAMKMENEILAPRAGKVVKVAVSDGTTVNTGEQLIIIE